MKTNKYKIISYAVLTTFLLLSTIQTLLDIKIYFDIQLYTSTYVGAVLTSIIPVLILISITNFIKIKTQNSNLFVITEVRSIIKTLFYFTLLSIFLIWSIMLVFIVITYYGVNTDFVNFINFIVLKIGYTIIYSFIVSLFFNSISKTRIKNEF